MRHFILVEALEGSHASIAVDQIKIVYAYRYEKLESKIELIDGTFKLHPASLARAYFRPVGCSGCCRLFIFFTRILKIIVILFGNTKISCIFVYN